MASDWPELSYKPWSATCDTLHAHTQVLGKLAVELAPPEPQLQHAALRLTARGWETEPLPAPDRSGAITAGLDLRTNEAFVEHSDGKETRIALTPNRPVAEVTREVLEAVERLAGPVTINPAPQEVPWEVPLDQDTEHTTYESDQVATYFTAASQAALVLGAFRASFRGRSTPVNAWWGTFDLAVALFSGNPAEPPAEDFISRNGGDAELIEIGWWPGDRNYDGAAFFAFAHPDFPMPTSIPSPLTGTRTSASSCSTGTTSAERRTRTPWRWSSLTRRFATRATSANGIQFWREPQRANRRRCARRASSRRGGSGAFPSFRGFSPPPACTRP